MGTGDRIWTAQAAPGGGSDRSRVGWVATQASDGWAPADPGQVGQPSCRPLVSSHHPVFPCRKVTRPGEPSLGCPFHLGTRCHRRAPPGRREVWKTQDPQMKPSFLRVDLGVGQHPQEGPTQVRLVHPTCEQVPSVETGCTQAGQCHRGTHTFLAASPTAAFIRGLGPWKGGRTSVSHLCLAGPSQVSLWVGRGLGLLG